jgi:hypothetical protein
VILRMLPRCLEFDKRVNLFSDDLIFDNYEVLRSHETNCFKKSLFLKLNLGGQIMSN